VQRRTYAIQRPYQPLPFLALHPLLVSLTDPALASRSLLSLSRSPCTPPSGRSRLPLHADPTQAATLNACAASHM
jgi:hypothetical protein